ncbi:MAG: pyridoxal-phosphate dependent enzyme [Lautropia sp.]|nr:pyridoxal-phosphate dependent enzyme [Lautropia sp.]
MPDLIECPESIFVKPELNSPGLSHKYRAAKLIIDEAVSQGAITPGTTTVIEKTGGNFGLGLVFACQHHGIDVELAVGLSFSQKKRRLLEFLGARLIGQEMLKRGMTPKEVIDFHLSQQHSMGKKYYFPDQFSNRLGIEAHRQETGHELARSLADRSNLAKDIIFIGGAGTGASMTGISIALRESGFSLQSILVEPDGSNMRTGSFSDHRLEGISVGVPAPFLDWDLISGVQSVTLDEVLAAQRWFFQNTGLLIGNSSAANIAVARRLRRNQTFKNLPLITIAYDSGSWYDDFMNAPRP